MNEEQMRTTPAPGAKKDRSRLVLGVGIAFVGVGVLLFVLSLALRHDALRLAAPYALLVGFALLVFYVVVRPPPDRRSKGQEEPTLFGKDTTVFASRLEGDGEEPRD
jgi:hypothetical protein